MKFKKLTESIIKGLSENTDMILEGTKLYFHDVSVNSFSTGKTIRPSLKGGLFSQFPQSGKESNQRYKICHPRKFGVVFKRAFTLKYPETNEISIHGFYQIKITKNISRSIYDKLFGGKFQDGPSEEKVFIEDKDEFEKVFEHFKELEKIYNPSIGTYWKGKNTED